MVARRTPPPKQRRNEVRTVWWRGPAIPPTPRTLLLHDVNRNILFANFLNSNLRGIVDNPIRNETTAKTTRVTTFVPNKFIFLILANSAL